MRCLECALVVKGAIFGLRYLLTLLKNLFFVFVCLLLGVCFFCCSFVVCFIFVFVLFCGFFVVNLNYLAKQVTFETKYVINRIY